jgi:hypothetical protein
MPTNRTPRSRRRPPAINAEMRHLFRVGHQMRVERDDLVWEEDGGCRDEYIEVSSRLHRLLGRKPWHLNVLDAGRKPLEHDPRVLANWRAARAIRRQLIAAASRHT